MLLLNKMIPKIVYLELTNFKELVCGDTIFLSFYVSSEPPSPTSPTAYKCEEGTEKQQWVDLISCVTKSLSLNNKACDVAAVRIYCLI